jgi:hypothetical protein
MSSLETLRNSPPNASAWTRPSERKSRELQPNNMNRGWPSLQHVVETSYLLSERTKKIFLQKYRVLAFFMINRSRHTFLLHLCLL